MTPHCDCSIDAGDFEQAEFCYARWRTARKQHSCCECFDPILPGQIYEETSGRWDGTLSRHKTCHTCVIIREHYCPHGWLYGELAQTIFDCLGFDYRTAEDDK